MSECVGDVTEKVLPAEAEEPDEDDVPYLQTLKKTNDKIHEISTTLDYLRDKINSENLEQQRQKEEENRAKIELNEHFLEVMRFEKWNKGVPIIDYETFMSPEHVSLRQKYRGVLVLFFQD